MRYVLLVALILGIIALIKPRSSRSDTSSGPGSSVSTIPPPTPGHAPFTQYDDGGSANEFAYDALDPVNQAYIDLNANQGSAWQPIVDAYQSGVVQLANQAQAEAAAQGLGVQSRD